MFLKGSPHIEHIGEVIGIIFLRQSVQRLLFSIRLVPVSFVLGELPLEVGLCFFSENLQSWQSGGKMTSVSLRLVIAKEFKSFL